MLEWPSATLYNGIRDVTDTNPDGVAVQGAEEVLTYSELLSRSEDLAQGLSDLGVGRDDTVAIWLGNRPEWIITQLAVSYLGAKVVAVNTRYRRHELEYMLKDSECRAIVTEGEFLGSNYLEMLADIVPSLRDVSSDNFDPDDLPLEEVISIAPHEEYSAVRSFGDVRARHNANPVTPSKDGARPVIVFYTSGTTGNPKGCLHSSTSVLNHSHQVGVHFSVKNEDVGLATLPLCGVMGYNFVWSTLTHGGELVCIPYFDAENAVNQVTDCGVTYCSATDEMFSRMIDVADEEAFSSLDKGAAFFANGYDEDTFERIEDAVGFPIVQPYGSSEVNSQVFVGDPDDPQELRKGVGGPLIFPSEEAAKITDPETGEELPDGERGELRVKGYNTLLRYLNKPEASGEAFEDGWFKTGDLCEKDENGYLYFHSRIDDALRVRGFLVSPPEIEQAIDEHPRVELSQVVGLPHPRHGEVPVAFVKGDVTSEEIQDHLSDQIADYKQPAEIEIIKEFPRTEGPHGEKIRKTDLRDQAVELFGDSV